MAGNLKSKKEGDARGLCKCQRVIALPDRRDDCVEVVSGRNRHMARKTTRSTRRSASKATEEDAVTSKSTGKAKVSNAKVAAVSAAVKKVSRVGKLFDEVQRSRSSHSKCLLLMRSLRARAKAEGSETLAAWDAHFLRHVHPLLLVFKSEPAVERCIEFILRFAVDQDAVSEEHSDEDGEDVSADAEFAVNLLASLIPLHNAKDKAVRLRVCQLVSGLLNGLGEDAEISDELWALLEEALLFRLKDKVPAVRSVVSLSISVAIYLSTYLFVRPSVSCFSHALLLLQVCRRCRAQALARPERRRRPRDLRVPPPPLLRH